ncbi:Palmitoyltransferase [Linnemannia gamsii]|uniref:Palmitoyltransferase n=1 Tax=Linnemannia gamsii TaxID=64522 RepID=A0ABQ7KFS2_9FUNG|nr:Palmitoyltransferase [Linnemannia gamsii]
MGSSNDKWIAFMAWTLFSFISISSQVFVFWPWLFGSWATSSASSHHTFVPMNPVEALDPFENGIGMLPFGGVEDSIDQSNGLTFGYLSVMWANLNVRALLYLVPFNCSLIMLCWNYYLTMTTSPGSPPLDWCPPIDGSSIEYKKTTHTPRYCRTCDAYKPPRTHHCRTCKKCVLKMDHHCPWVQNCIGYYNYGHFVRFITWTTISTFYCAVLLILRCVEAYENEKLGLNLQNAPTQEQMIMIVVDLCLDGSVLFGISILTTYHFWCISSNTTTIESWEKDRILTIIRRGKIREVKCPYHLGVLTNFQEILGQNPLLWLWPKPMLGDGLQFKVKSDSGERDDSDSESPVSLLSSSSFLSPPASISVASAGAGGVPLPSSSRSPMSKRWFGPTEVRQSRVDELVEMV